MVDDAQIWSHPGSFKHLRMSVVKQEQQHVNTNSEGFLHLLTIALFKKPTVKQEFLRFSEYNNQTSKLTFILA